MCHWDLAGGSWRARPPTGGLLECVRCIDGSVTVALRRALLLGLDIHCGLVWISFKVNAGVRFTVNKISTATTAAANGCCLIARPTCFVSHFRTRRCHKQENHLRNQYRYHY